MTDTTPIAVEVCCCGNCAAEGHEQSTTRLFTAEEIAAMEAAAAQAATEAAEREAAAEALAALKASARAKLVAGTPLTEEEAATLVI